MCGKVAATVISGVALLFSGFSLWETSLKQADLNVYVTGVVAYERDLTADDYILPAGGFVSPFESLWRNLVSMLMPALVLGTGVAAVMMRHVRSAMIMAMKQDYVRTARAKGVRDRTIVLRHALPNALIPVVTLGTLQFGELLAGAVLTEQVFSIPGFGKMIVDGVFSRDYAVVQAVVLCTAAVFLLMSLVADVAYVLLNPRLRS